MHWDFDKFIRVRVDTSPTPAPFNTMCKVLAAFLGTMFAMFYIGHVFPSYSPVAPKQYPYNNLYLENGGDPKNPPPEEKHHVFK